MGIDHSDPYIHSTTVLCDIYIVYSCGVFSETAPLQRSSTTPLKTTCMVGHFPAESACTL